MNLKPKAPPQISNPDRFRSLPSVEKLVGDHRLQAEAARYSHEALVDATRAVLQQSRKAIASGIAAPDIDALVASVRVQAASLYEPALRSVINATGVVIHTNLGRALLSDDAAAAVQGASLGYSNLELDLGAGARGSRHTLVEPLLQRLTGAEAGMAVNNNAAAVLLALTAFAHGKEVVVSRGEAVEIGGGFRVPDVLRESGAHLVEVGTTNRTYAADFERAATPQTAAFLRVHTSNFRVTGFVHQPSLEEMVEIGRRLGVLVIHDVGSGCLIDTRSFGLSKEPTPQESVAAGVDLVCFSGDKLLGGPQAGIIVGKKQHIEKLKHHPLARAVRLDKLTLAALEVTLLHYVKGEAAQKVPVWQMISATPESLKRVAQRWARTIGAPARVMPGMSAIGGGSLPGEELPTWLCAISGSGERIESLAQHLRQGVPSVLARIEGGSLVLDPRSVRPNEEKDLLAAVKRSLAG